MCVSACICVHLWSVKQKIRFVLVFHCLRFTFFFFYSLLIYMKVALLVPNCTACIA